MKKMILNAGWMSIVVCITMSCSEMTKEHVIATGTIIPHGDFEYTVTDYRKSNVLHVKDEALLTDGTFYVVSFRVTNHAVRINHEWDNAVAYIIDEDSNRYECKVDLQKKVNEAEPFGFKDTYVTPFQSEESTKLIFELPLSVKEPHLKVRGNILLEDFLDGSHFEKTKVRLF